MNSGVTLPTEKKEQQHWICSLCLCHEHLQAGHSHSTAAQSLTEGLASAQPVIHGGKQQCLAGCRFPAGNLTPNSSHSLLLLTLGLFQDCFVLVCFSKEGTRADPEGPLSPIAITVYISLTGRLSQKCPRVSSSDFKPAESKTA